MFWMRPAPRCLDLPYTIAINAMLLILFSVYSQDAAHLGLSTSPVCASRLILVTFSHTNVSLNSCMW